MRRRCCEWECSFAIITISNCEATPLEARCRHVQFARGGFVRTDANKIEYITLLSDSARFTFGMQALRYACPAAPRPGRRRQPCQRCEVVLVTPFIYKLELVDDDGADVPLQLTAGRTAATSAAPSP